MARINKVEPLVYNALLECPETRADDHILVLEVYKNFVSADMSLQAVFANHIVLGLPSLASIIRIRRKLQLKYPELVDGAAAEIRAGEEQEFRNYALNN